MDGNLSFKDVANNPILFAATLLKILDKYKNKIPLIYTPIQRDFLTKRTRRDLILKSRQLGMSTTIQAEIFRVVTTRSATALTLGVDDRNTQNLRRIFNRYYDNLPEEFKPEKKFDNRTIISFPKLESEVVIMTANSPASGRGNSYTHIHGSEVAFWSQPEAILSGALQGGLPSVVLESTPNGAQGWFYERCMEAFDAQTQNIPYTWRLHFYEWFKELTYKQEFDNPEQKESFIASLTDLELQAQLSFNLTPEQLLWRRNKISELGFRLFQQEYPETVQSCFLVSGVGYFTDIPHLEQLFTAPMDAKPDVNHKYVAGLDLGRNMDYTVLSVIDTSVEPNVEVDILRINNMSWFAIRERVVETLKYWNVDTLVIEINNMGGLFLEELFYELERQGLTSVRVVPYDTQGNRKTQLVNTFHNTLDYRDLKMLPEPTAKQEIYKYIAEQSLNGTWRFKASDGHDDTVMARMLADNARIMIGYSPIAVF